MQGGRVMSTPSLGSDFMGHVVRSWLSRDCAHSRAVVLRTSSEGFDGRGLLSFTRRFPRSKVCGMGLETVTELKEEVLAM